MIKGPFNNPFVQFWILADTFQCSHQDMNKIYLSAANILILWPAHPYISAPLSEREIR